jgi:aspartate carbamoyltransferase regulatory subunit
VEQQELSDKLLVRKIENGTVIDHVPAWKAELITKVLRTDRLAKSRPDISVVVLQNVRSERLGRKDLVKIDSWYVSEADADILSLTFPTITTNFVRNWRVSKYQPKIPERIEAKLRCPEVRCITNAEREPLTPRHRVIEERRLLQCQYCDSLVEFERIPDLIRA